MIPLDVVNARLRAEIPNTLVVRRPVAGDITRLRALANADRTAFPENYIVVPSAWTAARLATRLQQDNEKVVALDASGVVVALMACMTSGEVIVVDWFLVDGALTARERLRAIRSLALTLFIHLESTGCTTVQGEANRLAGIMRFPAAQGFTAPHGTDPVTGEVKTFKFDLPLEGLLRRVRANHLKNIAPGDPDWPV